jgi:hypothetical protein
MWHVWGRSEMHTGFWQGKIEREQLQDKDISGRTLLKLNVKDSG